ncbi:putative ATP synthase SpaL [Sodalis glossinidius str. 'morsitans']|uniref:protein-secreting ATPase n=2 Tax=Sodalis glossinidius TaxID=63612 RepID=Q2NR62_SODGM|nr:type III secretion system ATPase SctN [Sodalis glossinidius]AAS66861.1 InvC [Sodalis glossinidius]BAE75363.1 type III secretion apparatus SpaL/InvC [Sodalis glossinidius str. 'morsitans']CRL46388.1 putative ATP synthase SpaL [Sodalis glossinidius str. 'morsitans']
MERPLRMLRRQALPLRLSGPIIEAALPEVAVGEICEIRRHWRSREVIAHAQVLGFHHERTVLSLIGAAHGLSREILLHPTGGPLRVEVGDALLGTIIQPSGRISERLAPPPVRCNREWRAIDAPAPDYRQRAGVRQPFITGIRAFDGLLTCGIGQRVGIFSSAGCGKTMLMHQLIAQSDAEVFVIGLVGERGREVTEFVETLRHSPRRHQCVLVYATSNYASLERCNAALVATTVAEYFRDQGRRVVLFLDSLTRFARALRDVALAAGEAPARRGYPASVFDALPRVLERPGNSLSGSITAFYTVLLEGDDEPDPIADEIRSILDGHIYLSRKLSAASHYPAIDILHSASRVAGQVTDARQQALAGAMRGLLTRLEEMQTLIDLGEYRLGDNAENDRAHAQKQALWDFLRQDADQAEEFGQTLRLMHAFDA